METFTKEEGKTEDGALFSFDARDLLQEYMAEFEKAKSAKDNDKVKDLRHRIWILQDFAAGTKPNIPESELEEFMIDLRQDIQRKSTAKAQSHKGIEDTILEEQCQPTPTSTPSMEQIALQEKKLRKLKKKMTQTLTLKKRLQDGESLELNQIAKINREKELQDQIDEVEEDLYYLHRM